MSHARSDDPPDMLVELAIATLERDGRLFPAFLGIRVIPFQWLPVVFSAKNQKFAQSKQCGWYVIITTAF
jgi:hypothetical protein